MWACGKLTLGFALAIRASSHEVILPKKMSTSAAGVNLTGWLSPAQLKVGTTAPSTVGMCSTLPLMAAITESVIGASVPPKPTVWSEN